VLLLLPPPRPRPPRSTDFSILSLSARLAVSIYSSALPFSYPFGIFSTREGRIADVFTIVVSLDRKLRRGCRYRACFLSCSSPLSVSFLSRPFSSLPSIPSWSFLIVAREERQRERESEGGEGGGESKTAEVVIPRFSIFVTLARPLPPSRNALAFFPSCVTRVISIPTQIPA